MSIEDFEGSLVLERLAEIGAVDDFYEAIDSDQIGRAVALMKKAGIGAEMIEKVLEKIRE